MQRHAYDMSTAKRKCLGRPTFMDDAPSEGEANFNSILDLRCNVITSGTLARKSRIVAAGMFETERVRAHDFHLWLRMAKAGAKIGYQKKVLLKHRVGTDGISGDSISRVEREISAFERVRQTLDLDSQQQMIVTRRVAGLEADLAVEQGKSFLLAGDYREAARAFRRQPLSAFTKACRCFIPRTPRPTNARKAFQAPPGGGYCTSEGSMIDVRPASL